MGDRTQWDEYDATELLSKTSDSIPMLIDQGSDDKFLTDQLMPWHLQQVADRKGFPLTLRMQEGYDHSYYFISTFIGDHIGFHATRLHD